MHISNGIINGPVSLAYAAVALILLAVCLQRSRQDLSDRLAPMAGLVAAFIFAAQMLNFPVLAGVSGHLLGGALAATLVGPWVGALCVSVVLIVQALVFADGGVLALGLNISNMALLGTAVGYLVVAGLMKLLPRSASGVGAAVFLASIVSVLIASQGFVLQYALGGNVPLDLSYAKISAILGGTHLLIGVGEGVIAALAVIAVAKVRPDLVYALRGERLDGAVNTKRIVIAGLATAVVLAGGLSYFASSAPDGLDAMTQEGCDTGSCMADAEKDQELSGNTLADYSFKGIDGTTGVAGVVGVGLTFAAGLVIFRIVRRRRVQV